MLLAILTLFTEKIGSSSLNNTTINFKVNILAFSFK